MSAPEELEGVDLRSPGTVDRYLYASGIIHPGTRAGLEPLASVTKNGVKTVLLRDDESLRDTSFNLSDDPTETKPFESTGVDSSAVIEYWTRPSDYDPPVVSDSEIRIHLKSLGYI